MCCITSSCVCQTGSTGTPGVAGVPGREGLKGDKGDQGNPGFQGESGQKGDSGARGLDVCHEAAFHDFHFIFIHDLKVQCVRFRGIYWKNMSEMEYSIY